MNPNNLTQEQIQQGYSTIPGAYNPVTGQLKSTITTDQLTPAPKVDLTPSFTPQPDLATGIVTGAQQGVNQFQKDYERFLGLQNQNQDKSLENMISSITGDLQGLQGRGQAQLEAEGRLGVNQFNQQLAGLNTQIGSKIAEYNQNLANQRAELAQMEAGAGAKGLTTGMLLGQQGAVEKVRSAQNAQAAADIGLLQAQALGLQGQAKAAQDAANRAVDLLYQDREATVNTKLKQIELFTPLFNASEKKKADALTYALGNEQKKLEEEKQNQKEIQSLIINASSQEAPQDLLQRASKAKTAGEASMILGAYAGDYYAIQKMKKELSGMGYSGSVPSGISGTGRIVVAGVSQESPAYAWLDQYNAGAMSLEDIYAKIGSSKTAEVVKNDLAKLISAQGGKRVIKMDDVMIASINDQIKNIDDLLGESGYNYKVISGAVQGGALGVGARLTGAKGDALAMARNLVSNQTLQSLADAKAKGVTFGALSEAELNAVANAASRIASKIIKDENGQIIGFSGSEAGFKADLLKVKEGLEKSIQVKTGTQGSVNKQIEDADAVLRKTYEEPTGGYQFK